MVHQLSIKMINLQKPLQNQMKNKLSMNEKSETPNFATWDFFVEKGKSYNIAKHTQPLFYAKDRSIKNSIGSVHKN